MSTMRSALAPAPQPLALPPKAVGAQGPSAVAVCGLDHPYDRQDAIDAIPRRLDGAHVQTDRVATDPDGHAAGLAVASAW